MVLACCTRVLRAGFLVLAAPLLLTGTLFHHVGNKLQQNGMRDAEYATGEWAASGALQKAATESVAQSAEDEAIASDLEADVSRNGEEAGASEATADEAATVVGESEGTAATEAGTALVVQEVPGVNVAADATEGAAIIGQEATAAVAAAAWLKNKGLAAVSTAQAAADGGLATEKTAEATALQASAATEEAASVTAREEAAKTSLLAAPFFLEAALCQLLSVVVQAPVAIMLLAKWSATTIAAPCSTACISVGGMGEKGPLFAASWMASRVSLTAVVASFVAAPWAATVLAASVRGETLFSEAGSAAGNVVQLVPTSRTARLLLGQHKKAAEPHWLNGLNPFGHDFETTTVNPTTIPPPIQEERWEMLTGAARLTMEPMLRWTGPVLVDVGLISSLFGAATLATGLGRHTPAVKQGRLSHHAAFLVASRDALSCWLWGLMLLIAVWILSIILASELRPVAEHVQSFHVAPLVCGIFAMLCLIVHLLHGYAQSSVAEDKPATFNREGDPPLGNYDPVLPADVEAAGGSSVASAAAVGVASCAGAACAALVEMVLLAVEGPINAWAVGGSYKAIVMCWTVVAITPWQDLTPKLVHSIMAIAAVACICTCGVFVVGTLRWLVRKQARELESL